MDVSDWTVDQRMRLPDWCFGNRTVIGISILCPLLETGYYGISEIALPDPACIWQVGWWYKTDTISGVTLRIGLRATIPTSVPDMDDATEILPYMGSPHAGPNEIFMTIRESLPFFINLRKGMVTGGKKLVVRSYSDAAQAHANVCLIVSELPTSMAGWLAHNK